MILIINTSSVKKGGSIQVALSFISECKEFPDNTYHVFLSEETSREIIKSEYSNNFNFYLLPYSPSSLIHYFKAIKKLKQLESDIKPDCVFTVFGPSYWTPRAPHLVGYGRGYYLYPESPFFKRIKLFLRLRIILLKEIHRFFFKLNSDYYYIESEDAKHRLSSFLGKNKDNIYVISNTYHSVFNFKLNEASILPPKRSDEIRLVTISSFYPHKNLEIITDVISELKKKSLLKYIFILTVSDSIFESKFITFKENIINLGPMPIYQCPKVYQEADFLFLPTLVEIFTASYLEAMKMKKPILTSDLPFARNICGDAAEFFDPLDPEKIADKIISLTDHVEYQKTLVKKGEKRLLCFETPESRTEKLLTICDGLIVRQK